MNTVRFKSFIYRSYKIGPKLNLYVFLLEPRRRHPFIKCFTYMDRQIYSSQMSPHRGRDLATQPQRLFCHPYSGHTVCHTLQNFSTVKYIPFRASTPFPLSEVLQDVGIDVAIAWATDKVYARKEITSQTD